jgi:hypothetical protein
VFVVDALPQVSRFNSQECLQAKKFMALNHYNYKIFRVSLLLNLGAKLKRQRQTKHLGDTNKFMERHT